MDKMSFVNFIKLTLRSNFHTDKQFEVDSSMCQTWKNWSQKVWETIQCKFTKEIRHFSTLAIFPIVEYEPANRWEDAKKLKLVQLTDLLFQMERNKHYNSADNEQVLQSLELLSVSVVRNFPPWLDKQCVREYVYNDSFESLMMLMTQLTESDIKQFNENATLAQRQQLLLFLSETITETPPEACLKLLRKAKIFREFDSLQQPRPNFICLEENAKCFTGKEFPIDFPTPVIITGCYNIDRIFGAHFINIENMIKLVLREIDKYSMSDKERFMLWLLESEIYFRDEEIRYMAAHVAFVRVENSDEIRRPCDLYDPEDKLLRKVFRSEPHFPLRCTKKVIEGFRNLGMKTKKDVTYEDLRRTCTIIHDMSLEKFPPDFKKAHALVKFLNNNTQFLDTIGMRDLRFIPLSQKRIENYSANFPCETIDHGSRFCSPSEVKSSKFAHLIGSVKPLIDTKQLSNMSKVFAWDEEPLIQDVAEHLAKLIKHYQQKYKSSCIEMVTNIYRWLACQEVQAVKHALKQTIASNKFVWIGDGFLEPDYVIVEYHEDDIHLEPFIHSLPVELQEVRAFLLDIGCCRHLTFDHYIDTLKRVKDAANHEFKHMSTSALRNMVVMILNKLKTDFVDKVRASERHVYFPVYTDDNSTLIMKPMQLCTFCDAQWLKDEYLTEDEEIYYVHADVPNSTAEVLGVPSLSQQMLSEADAFEEWGQEEPLTRRLHNLLMEGYVDGFSVAKELFQNADDAGASKLWIMYDERENKDCCTQLLSDSMSEWQGPALWIYNDAEFTDDDFVNITKLNGATKKDDLTKIGKFGLGFCAVYNVTDVPSFISREWLVIFDPHTKFLGKALPGKSPGLKINFRSIKNMKMMKRLRNQFIPYENVFGCKLISSDQPYFRGTLFRLPLRKNASDISSHIYTKCDVEILLDKFRKMSANLFIFNQNLKELKLFHLLATSKNPEEAFQTFQVSKDTIRMKTSPERLFFKHDNLASEMETSDVQSTPIAAAVARWKQERLLKHEPISILDKVCITVNEISKKSNTLLCEATWFVSWSTAINDQTLEKAYTEQGALPLGAVAVPVTEVKSTTHISCYIILKLEQLPESFYKTGHFFFFLPLPVEHNFQWHINGQFSVTSDRRHLRSATRDDTDTQAAQWNECILNDATVQSLLNLLENLKGYIDNDNYSFHQLWPLHDNAVLTNCLPLSFYKILADSNMFSIFKGNANWSNFANSSFLHPELRSTTRIGDLAFEMMSELADDTNVIDIPPDVYDLLLKAAGIKTRRKTIENECFLMKYFLPNLSRFEMDSSRRHKRDEILKFALFFENKNVLDWLKVNPCIPVQERHDLKRISDLIDPSSEISKLFFVADGYFPALSFDDIETRHRLQILGMMYTTLTDSLLVDRAISITPLNEHCFKCALERFQHLFCYLSDNENSHSMAFDRIKSIPCLPIMAKPKTWPFNWKADTQLKTDEIKPKACERHKSVPKTQHVYMCPYKLYDKGCSNLVGCLFLIFEPSGLPCKIKKLLRSLGVSGTEKQHIQPNIVIENLDIMSQSFRPTAKCNHYAFANIFGDIYTFLESALESGRIEIGYLRQLIHQKSVIFVNGIFTTPDNVAEEFDDNCVPYLHSLHSSSLSTCKHLIQALEIKKYFQPTDFAKVLQTLYEQHGSTPLANGLKDTCLKLLTCLHKSMVHCNVQDVFKHGVDVIYAPDCRCILRDTRTMCFNDYDDIETSDTMIYIHGDVCRNAAKAFGVKKKVIQNLLENSDNMEDFYQYEPLLTRLKRLVEGYPCDTGIFKELLQNADDAGAHEVCFLKDYTFHKSTAFQDETFSPLLLGPALCVYNDSSFSQANLKGIQMLGEGSKGDDPIQTGRYGVGFNAVYNLTDVPSFLTKGDEIEGGETLCIFDPNAKYLPHLITKQNPGKRFKNISETIRRRFDNVLSGHHDQSSIFFREGKGTMFRLPLRNISMAKMSEIKKEPIDEKFLTGLLNKFREELPEIVLFLKSICKINILTYVDGRYSQEYSIIKEMSQEDIEKRQAFYQNMKLVSRSMKTKADVSLFLEQRTVNYELHITEIDRKGTQSQRCYRLSEVFGFRTNAISGIVQEKLVNGSLGLLPHGGVALELNSEISDSNSKMERQCKLFCFLPLPGTTGLPVHVHGYFALDHESRRTLWSSEHLDCCYRSLWNCLIIKETICKAYIDILRNLKDKWFRVCTGETVEVYEWIQKFQRIFPNHVSVEHFYWKELVKHFYKELVDTEEHFLPVIRNEYKNELNVDRAHLVKLSHLSWLPLLMKTDHFQAYHNEESLNDLSQNNSDFTSILRNVGMKIVYASDKIRSSMEFANVPLQTLEPRDVIEFLSSFDKGFSDGCTITTMQHVCKTSLELPQNANTLLDFCLSDKTGFIVENISHIPIFLTADCVVTTLRNMEPLFVTTYNDLFDNERHLFLHESLVLTLNKYNYREHFCSMFKHFELEDFVELAKRSNIVKVNSDAMIPWDYINPSKTWILKFWQYFHHAITDKDIMRGLGIIQELSIIPARENNQMENLLVSPRHITSLIEKNLFAIGNRLQEILQKIRLPELNCSLFPEKLAQLVLHQIPNISKPVEIVKCLFKHSSRITEASLSKEESNIILIYIKQNIDVPGMNLVKEMIKSLPIFWSHFGERVVLFQYSKICVVPHMLPIDGLKEVARQLSILFLTDIYEHRDLFEFLGIRGVSICDVYIHYLFPNEHILTRQTFYKHIHYISNKISSLDSKNQKALLDHLRELRFIETDDGRKVAAKDLFNPLHSIFKVMCKTSELLPNALNNGSVIALLIKVGLKDDMSIELFERFANDIAVAGQKHENKNIVISNSAMLVQCFFLMDRSFLEQSDLYTLSRIKFVVPFVVDSELDRIHRQHLSTPLISFNGSVPNNKQNVCWTVSDLLPRNADPCNYLNGDVLKQVTEMLQICTVPIFSIVKKHVKNVGNSLDKKLKLGPQEISFKTVEVVIKDIYTELNHLMLADEESRNQLSELCSVPLIYFPYDKYILKSSNIIINCKDNEEIPPFIKKVPNVYGEYFELFLSMGASKEPSCNIYAGVLSALAIECQDSILLHHELDTAVKAMMHLLKHVVQTSADTINLSVEKLYLLHKENKLCDAKTLVVSNNTYFRERLDRGMSLNYSIDFNIFKEGLRINDCFDGLSKLDDQYRPHFLTDIVQEKVCLKNISYHDNPNASWLEGFLRSRIFINGFLRLAKHAHKLDNKTWSPEIEQKMMLYFQSISCKSVSGMETVLVVKTIVDGKLGSDIQVNHTNEKKSFHLEDTCSGIIIYFEQTNGDEDNDWLKNINELLSVHLNTYANGCLKDKMLLLTLNILNLMNSPEKISEILDKNKIDEYQCEFPLEFDQLRFPTPGQFVPKSLYMFLDNDYGAIYEHDYNFMALEIEDPAIDNEYEESDITSKANSDDAEMDQTPTYIYVKIRLKKEPVAELPLLQIYEVDVGDEIILVPAYRLYKFIRNKRQIDRETKQLCLYEGPLSDNNKYTQCLKDVFAEIRRYLKEAKDELERKRLYKRLMLQWHPDKNPSNVDFCTKVCQYILTCMQRLQDGLDLLDDEEGTDDIGSSCSSTRGDGQRSSSSWYHRFWKNFRSHSGWRNYSENSNSYYNESDDEQKSYKRKKYRRKERNQYPDFKTSFVNAEYEPYHYYSEAKRWQRQAESDLDNAKASLVEMTSPGFNWVCYKGHQAAEKTLKAAWYAKDANKMCKIKHSHQLYKIAQGLGSDIEQLARQISALTGDDTRMRYPDTWCGKIPAEAYKRANAEEVVTLVKTLTETLHAIVYAYA